MTSVMPPDLGEPEPNEEPDSTAQLRIEFDDKSVDVRGPSRRLTELSDSMSLAIATTGGAVGPALAVSALPGSAPAWVTGALVGGQLLFLAYVVTTICVRRRRHRAA